MKEDTNPKGPFSGEKENAGISEAGATVVKNGPFDYSESANEEKDRIDRMKNGHDKGNYSQYNGSI